MATNYKNQWAIYIWYRSKDKFSDFLLLQIMRWLNFPSEKEKELILRKRELMSEQSLISMVDSFAKFSKLQRQINAINEELSEIQSSRNYNNLKYQFFFTYIFKIVAGIALLIMSICYRYDPVLRISKTFDLTPFTGLISYPNNINDVSLHFWVVCCTTVARLIPEELINKFCY